MLRKVPGKIRPGCERIPAPIRNCFLSIEPSHKFTADCFEPFYDSPFKPQTSGNASLVHTGFKHGITVKQGLIRMANHGHNRCGQDRKTLPRAFRRFAQISLNPDLFTISGIVSGISAVTNNDGACAMAATDLIIFLGRRLVSYYAVFHKQGPGLWVDIIWSFYPYHNPPPLIPPKGGKRMPRHGRFLLSLSNESSGLKLSFLEVVIFSRQAMIYEKNRINLRY